MKRRRTCCRVLVGWEDPKEMTVPRVCRAPATYRHPGYGECICAEHRRANASRGFTIVPREGPWIGVAAGHAWKPICLDS